MPQTAPSITARNVRGFTLIELMIAVAIVAIIGVVAFPSFLDSIRKSRRTDAFTLISAAQLAQERCRANNPTFCTSITDATTASPPGLGLPSATTGNGYYTVAIVANSVTATGYDIVAAPVSGKSQVNDGDCAQLGVRVANGNITYGSANAAGTVSYAANNRCWAR